MGEGSFGNTYRLTGGFHAEFSVNTVEQETQITNTHLLSSGPDDNFQFHVTIHVTVNANGDLTAFISQVMVVCAG